MTDRKRTNNDLCTPGPVLDVVRQLGPIALDPCSNPWSTVGAAIELDGSEGRCGLAADWSAAGGIVWVNPPYGRGHMRKWAQKIATEAGRGVEIVALVKGDYSTAWWRTLRIHADAIAYWSERISFGGGEFGCGNFASAFFYFGPRPFAFAGAFEQWADVRVLR